MFGMEAALFVPSGTMGNLIAGDHMIPETQKHTETSSIYIPAPVSSMGQQHTIQCVFVCVCLCVCVNCKPVAA